MFGRDSKANRGIGKLYSDKKRKASDVLVDSCWPRKLGQGIFCDWFRKNIELSLVGLSLMQEQRLGKLAIILQVLPVLI